ncbi:hypothetical protein J8273_2682 [Carpediemonas membranifera]|uniref:Transmembrane protein n=1 Tax=Carpediemonas membranifera TaxID=201153 RepID=A0A8J6EAZ2_9EUKA|nr:hypothetical protein J8273_2682 [Carpediemonas membranifera]|eukprot:KAG9395770.1 hypothetical protein J8273_2682 [Carpediemonas membranifera]
MGLITKKHTVDTVYVISGLLLTAALCIILFLPLIGVPSTIPAILVVALVLGLWVVLILFPTTDAVAAPTCELPQWNEEVEQATQVAHVTAVDFPAFNYDATPVDAVERYEAEPVEGPEAV